MVVSFLGRLSKKADDCNHKENLIWSRLLLLQIFIPPDDKLWTFPAGIAQCEPLWWRRPPWSWCQCTSQNDWSYHFVLFWRCQKLRGKSINLTKVDQVTEGRWWQPNNFLLLLPSKIGFASRICCSIQECWPLTAARNCSMSLVFSVFPAPDSPLKTKIRHQRQDVSNVVRTSSFWIPLGLTVLYANKHMINWLKSPLKNSQLAHRWPSLIHLHLLYTVICWYLVATEADLMIQHWLFRLRRMLKKQLSAMAKTCGGSSPSRWSVYICTCSVV